MNANENINISIPLIIKILCIFGAMEKEQDMTESPVAKSDIKDTIDRKILNLPLNHPPNH